MFPWFSSFRADAKNERTTKGKKAYKAKLVFAFYLRKEKEEKR
jgi:hypothetical protein